MKSSNDSAGRISRTFSSNLFFQFVLLTAFLFLLGTADSLFAAFQSRSQNFVVTADTADLAEKVARCAEESRSRLAKLWLGTEIPAWQTSCPIQVKCGPEMGAGGETTFTFVNNTVTGWKMTVQGTEERILDSVVPHEVSHTILASYFCRPVPRWIDEGAATSIEADVERNNYRSMLIGFLQEHRGIPFNTMVQLSEYPSDMMPFYSQGFSVCEYLIAVGGHRRLIEFAREGIQSGNWSASVNKYYGYKDLSELQIKWTNWVSEWHNGGHSSKLPQVAKVADYPYNIYGQPIAGIAVASNNNNTAPAVNHQNPNSLIPSNPLNSFVAMPQPGAEMGNESVSFEAGVGTASPDTLVAVSAGSGSESVLNPAEMEYKGSYGHRDSAAGNMNSIRINGNPTILGQSPSF